MDEWHHFIGIHEKSAVLTQFSILHVLWEISKIGLPSFLLHQFGHVYLNFPKIPFGQKWLKIPHFCIQNDFWARNNELQGIYRIFFINGLLSAAKIK